MRSLLIIIGTSCNNLIFWYYFRIMANIVVTRRRTENNNSVVKRFLKAFRAAGIAKKFKGKMYFTRKPSKYTKKKSALHRIKKREEMRRLYKLGKI